MLIALDIGNVCVQLQLEESARLFGYELSAQPEAFTNLTYQYETGKIDTPEFLNKVSGLTGMSGAEVKHAWDVKVGREMPGMAEAVRDFSSKGIEFAFLSDIGGLHLTKFRRTVSFVHLVKGGIFSCETGCCKPEKQIFQAFESTYGKPDLFFDDMERNIRGAAAFGWRAVRFTGAELFRETVNRYLAERL